MSNAKSEEMCEVVRVCAVWPHPNADKLDMVSFETPAGQSAYRCISQRGAFTPGAYAVYLAVDTLVPRAGVDPRLAFLFQREDGKSKDVYRLRAARLRGEYSEGLLIPATPAEAALGVGADLSYELGVSYYRPAEPQGPTAATPGGKARDPELGGLFPIYGVTSLKKVPHLFAEGEEVLFTEKVHGTNMRAGWLPVGFFGTQRFVVGSHRVVKTDLRGWLRRAWDRLRGRGRAAGWYGEDLWSEAARVHDLARKLRAHPDLVCYFELYGVTAEGKRIQDLTYGDATLGLTLIDAYDADTGTWLTWNELGAVAARIGVERPPVMADGPWVSLDHHKPLAEGESVLAPGQVREGFVARPLADARRGKFVGQGYLLRKGAE